MAVETGVTVPSSCENLQANASRENTANLGGCAAAVYCAYYGIPPSTCEGIGREVGKLAADAFAAVAAKPGSGSIGQVVEGRLFEMGRLGGLTWSTHDEFTESMRASGWGYVDRPPGPGVNNYTRTTFYVNGMPVDYPTAWNKGVAIVTTLIARRRVAMQRSGPERFFDTLATGLRQLTQLFR